MQLHCKAHGKINWALNIIGRREDGYHTLDMLMHSIDLFDEMTFEPAEDLSLTVDGAVPRDAEKNLVIRAARALNRRTGTRCGAHISLIKHIPARAGLGGGSADCAATLRALNAMWRLNLSEGELSDIGLTLGADVPFCLAGGLARVTGIGENIEPLPHPPEIPLVLVTPGGGLSTGAVFSEWDRGGFPPVSLDAAALAQAVIHRDLAAVDALCVNALTAPALKLMPEIGDALRSMKSLGAKAAFMTGSGSTAVGAFSDGEAARRAASALPGAILTHTLSETR